LDELFGWQPGSHQVSKEIDDEPKKVQRGISIFIPRIMVSFGNGSVHLFDKTEYQNVEKFHNEITQISKKFQQSSAPKDFVEIQSTINTSRPKLSRTWRDIFMIEDRIRKRGIQLYKKNNVNTLLRLCFSIGFHGVIISGSHVGLEFLIKSISNKIGVLHHVGIQIFVQLFC